MTLRNTTLLNVGNVKTEVVEKLIDTLPLTVASNPLIEIVESEVKRTCKKLVIET